MDDYIANGVQLGWLIDPIKHAVTIYRAGQSSQVVSNPATIEGEGPVAGFVLHLSLILG